MHGAVTPAKVAGIFTQYEIAFHEGYNQPEVWYEKLCTIRSSGTSQNTYAWMGQLPMMREWVGPRVIERLSLHGYTIVNRDFEKTVALPQNMVEDDTYGSLEPVVQELGYAARKNPDVIVREAIEDNPECFDGKAFFAANHPVDLYDSSKGTYGNLHKSHALTPENFAKGMVAMRKVKGPSGLPLGVRPSHIIVPAALVPVARRIVKADRMVEPVTQASPGTGFTAVGLDNIWKDSVEIIEIDELVDEEAWYLADLRRPIKPFIWQNRQDPRFVWKNQPTDTNVFMEKEYLFGVDSRGNAGVSLPFLCHKFTAAA